ncbi:ubiquinone anaerobic biosynthesis protein UbiU [Permianibacter aggregans]|uniref:Ubiquinone biosynthesis protein UbiU n=1 Tax=Permianibacter aggregans TaxID=1510150 RepID=A0A4R6UAT6_9GAMM|nr:peptidase U32 family protein [Permianibacter aggregans]QGX40936.1 U32 family peptidase [Permianibacter aggregans]TDQ43631.1 putative protease [Permianibacter aggregans]
MELVCPAGNLQALKLAIENGADAIYTGFRDDTNARHFAGLNFSDAEYEQAIRLVRTRQRKLFLAINTFAQAGQWPRWQRAVDRAAELGVDALIVADLAVLDYAANRYPQLPLHLSVQASATTQEALRFYQRSFAIRRAVLPRVLSLQQLAAVSKEAPCEIEVFGFGSLCIMAEGRCQLSSYLTGESPNTCGACSPARFVRWEEKNRMLESRLNGVLIDRFAEQENAGYPTLCKGRFIVDGKRTHALEEPVSLNTLELLPELIHNGIRAIKIEGRQRSPSYVAQVTKVWRAAIDAATHAPENFSSRPDWQQALAQLSEGKQTTFGAYQRAWQ